MHTGPDGHGLDEPVEKAGILELTAAWLLRFYLCTLDQGWVGEKAGLPEWTPLWLILVSSCTLELMVTDWTVWCKTESDILTEYTNITN